MKRLIVILTVSMLCVASADAGVITWGAPQNSSGPGDVSTNFSTIEAINLTDAAGVPGTTTVNGVTFTHDDTLMGLLGGTGLLDGNTSGDTAYDALLDSVDHGNSAVADPWPIQVGGGNLTVGAAYEIQLWYTDRRGFATGFTQIYDDGNGNTVTLSATGSGLGQFVIGTFIADGPTQTLIIDNGNPPGEPHLNAYQIRSQQQVTGVPISQSDGVTFTSEAGITDSYTVALQTEPTADVAITATPGDGEVDIGNGPGGAVTLTFTTVNWNTAQTVTVTAFDDAVYEGGPNGNPHISTISHSAQQSGGSGEYDGISIVSVDASVLDNDLTCGDWGYDQADFNLDCYVNLFDYAEFAIHWLEGY